MRFRAVLDRSDRVLAGPRLVVSGRRLVALVMDRDVAAQFAAHHRSVLVYARSAWNDGVLSVNPALPTSTALVEALYGHRR